MDAREYRHFQHSEGVRYTAIQGEFYWHIDPDFKVDTHDYVCPPYIVCREIEPGEEQWTRGQYLDAREVWSSFGQPGSPPPQYGVAPCQPNPYRERARRMGKTAAISVCALVLLSVLLAVALPRSLVHTVTVPVGRESQIVLSELDIRGSTHAVEIVAQAVSAFWLLQAPPGADPWVGLDVSLINDATGAADTVGLELWEAADGYDRQRQASDTIGSITPGHYVLRVESFTQPGTAYDASGEIRIEVRHGSFLWFPAIASLVLLLAPALIEIWRSAALEKKRWSESDHGPGD